MSTELLVDGNPVDGQIVEKWELLLQKLKDLKKAAIAFSGGVDSTFLLYAACRALGDNVLAVTVQSDWVPMRETSESEAFCKVYGIRQVICRIREEDVEGFLENPPDRCYLCKKVLFCRMMEMAAAEGYEQMLDGSNINDISDYRPGVRALRELGVISPLQEVGLTKEEIRILSRAHGLNTWQKPSFACLASRFPAAATAQTPLGRHIQATIGTLGTACSTSCAGRYPATTARRSQRLTFPAPAI